MSAHEEVAEKPAAVPAAAEEVSSEEVTNEGLTRKGVSGTGASPAAGSPGTDPDSGSGSPAPDVTGLLSQFSRVIVELYKNLLCRGERTASRALFRAAYQATHYLSNARQLETGIERSARAAAAARHVQQCLYWLWMLDGAGYMPGEMERDRVYGVAWATLKYARSVAAETRE